MEEGELVRLSDLIKMKVYDAEGLHIGHLQDLALDCDLSSPYLTYLGIHLHWTDRVGEFELVRPVEDIVLLLPWHQVQDIDESGIHLQCVHPDIPVVTAGGKCLIRRDVLNKQMLDTDGNRIQRVDDLVIEREGKTLKVVGLEIGMGWLSSSPSLQKLMEKMKRRLGSWQDREMIPWEAVLRIDDDAVILGEGPKEEPS